jgi:molecular chaperone HscB
MADAFDILGLPPRFDLQPDQLQRAYLSRVAALHPDHSGLTEDGATEEEARAAALNEARAVLADPLQRAEVLMRRLGGPGVGDDRSLPAGFLAEMLEWREQLEEEQPLDAARAAEWRARAGARREALSETLRGAFARGDAEALGTARRAMNQWRYIDRLLEQLASPDVG